MKKISKIFVLIICFFVAFLIVAPFFLNSSSIKFQLEQRISQKFNSNFEIQGKVSITFLPVPRIYAQNVEITKMLVGENYFSDVIIKSLTIEPEILSLFGEKVKIDKITLDYPKVKNYYSDKNKEGNGGGNQPAKGSKDKGRGNINSDDFINNIFNFKNSKVDYFDFQNINNITLKGGSFLKKSLIDEVELEFSNIHFEIENNIKKQMFTAEGSFISGNLPTSFQLVAATDNNQNSILTIQSSIVNAALSGKFINSDIKNLVTSNFSGKLDAEIIDLKSFVKKYLSKNSLFYQRVNSDAPIKISADIKNSSGEIKIDNIIINSQLIDGKGNIAANLSRIKPSIDTNFEFNNLDIDSLWSSGPLFKNTNMINSENNIIQKFVKGKSLPKSLNQDKTIVINNIEQDSKTLKSPLLFNSLDLTAEIKIKIARYMGADLHDVNLYFIASENGNILLQPLEVKIPGNGNIVVNGALERENDIPKFIGRISIEGKNLDQSLSWLNIDVKDFKSNFLTTYQAYSDLLILPNFTIFSNTNLNINNGGQKISGGIKIDNSSGVKSVTTNLAINHFNYDEFFADGTFDKHLSGNKSLLEKLLWLNTINASHNISLIFNKFSYGKATFLKQPLNIQYGQGYFKVSDFNFISPNNDIKGNLDIDIRKQDPKLSLNITSDNLVYLSDKKKSNFDKYFFNLPSLSDFSGNINIKITNLLVDSWKAREFKIFGDLLQGSLDIDDFSFKSYNGNCKYYGSIILRKTKTINGSFLLEGVDSKPLLSDIMGINNISGISNISGIINSNAQDKSEFFRNLDTQIKFIGANVVVNSFGINNLVNALQYPNQYKSALLDMSAILYDPLSKSFFKDIKGMLNINRNKNQFQIETKSIGLNSVVYGSADIENRSIEGGANFIFITRTSQNTIPLNLAINFQGKSGSISQNTNFNQIEQYLQMSKPH